MRARSSRPTRTTVWDDNKSAVAVEDETKPGESVWRFLAEKAPWEKKGHMVKLCEFRGCLRGVQDVVDHWMELRFNME